MAVLSLVLDILIIGLLAATITYAVILNKQLNRLREGRGELQALIKGFTEATQRAEAGIKGMKRAAAETGEPLQRAIDRAESLREELQQVVEASEVLAGRLEGLASERGRNALPPAPTAATTPAAERSQGHARVAAARARAAELGDGPAAGNTGGGSSASPGRRARPTPETAAPASAAAPAPAKGKPGDELEGLSRAERELLKAIEGRR